MQKLTTEQSQFLENAQPLLASNDPVNWSVAYNALKAVGLYRQQIITEFVWIQMGGASMMPKNWVFTALFGVGNHRYFHASECLHYLKHISRFSHLPDDNLDAYTHEFTQRWVSKFISYQYCDLRKSNYELFFYNLCHRKDYIDRRGKLGTKGHDIVYKFRQIKTFNSIIEFMANDFELEDAIETARTTHSSFTEALENNYIRYNIVYVDTYSNRWF